MSNFFQLVHQIKRMQKLSPPGINIINFGHIEKQIQVLEDKLQNLQSKSRDYAFISEEKEVRNQLEFLYICERKMGSKGKRNVDA